MLEYNVRFGDPETQSLMLRLETDLVPMLSQAASGRFETLRLKFRKEASACVVLASKGYPEKPVKGEPITGIEEASALEGVEIFHGSTAVKNGKLVAAGGRVLCVCATGPQLRDALRRAYKAVTLVQWPSRILRHDIGKRVLEVIEKAGNSGG